MDLLKLGKYLRDQRRGVGISAKDLAQTVGVSRAYLSILETGRNPKTRKPSKPSFEVLARLSKALALDLKTLLTLAGYPDELIEILHQESTKPRENERALRVITKKIEELHIEVKNAISAFSSMPQDEVPSGIQGFKVHVEDHILLLSESESGDDFDLTWKFVAAGLSHREASLVRLPPSISAGGAEDAIRSRSHGRNLERLTIVPWDRGVLPYYKARRFSKEGTIKADATDLERTSATKGSIIRFATPDASHYFAWVKNPEDVLEYENMWASDLHSFFPQGRFLFLCLYRMRDLKRRVKPGLSLAQMILSLLESHNKIVLLAAGNALHCDTRAVRLLFARLNLREAKPEMWNRIHEIGERFGVWRDTD